MDNANEINTETPKKPVNRRHFLKHFAGTAVATTAFPAALWSQYAASQENGITTKMIEEAEWIAGLDFTEDNRKLMTDELNYFMRCYSDIRDLKITNDIPPALRFDPVLPGATFDTEVRPFLLSQGQPRLLPANRDEIAFWSVLDLSRLIKTQKITSLELTQIYIRRLKKYDPMLKCVITLMEDSAIAQAKQADAEITAGNYRGPLHGIPWGAKDLLAVKGYPTTWGATPYKDQVIDQDATVVQRLNAAGGVLVAKLTLGALAMGDYWFGGRTNSPWNPTDPEDGSSGSSAGPAATVSAGLVGFAIGSETRGSIVSPSTRCGLTGFRPTYGRVSRHGAMALSWSMDKLGPMCRTVEDCAIVFNAIHGPDGNDPTVVDMPFNWNPYQPLSSIRIGYLKDAFRKEHDLQSLETLRSLGVNPIPVELPDFPVDALDIILGAEAAAAFDELTRSGRLDELVRQEDHNWPSNFRRARLIPAVEYIQANRARTLLMQATAVALKDVDVHLTPTEASLALDNLTGHPLVSLQNGFDDKGDPTSIGLMGGLYQDAALLRVAKALQDATDFHLKHPPLVQA